MVYNKKTIKFYLFFHIIFIKYLSQFIAKSLLTYLNLLIAKNILLAKLL